MFGALSFLEDVWIKALHRFSNAFTSLHLISLLRGELDTRHNLKSGPHGVWQTGGTVLGSVSIGDHLRRELDKHGIYEINLEKRECYMIVAQVTRW